MEHKLAAIKREHIEQAAKIIDKEGMPAINVGDYLLTVNGKNYHFKYITRVAYKLATGIETDSNFFQSNQYYRQKIIDLGFPVVIKTHNVMIKNPFLLSDEKLTTLLKAYTSWLEKSKKEQGYVDMFKKESELIRQTFLNQHYLDEVKDAELREKIKNYVANLEGPVGINLGEARISNNLKRLKDNFRYIITTNDDPFAVVQALIEGEKKIEYFSKAFWSPILQAKYPDVIPNWNNKTENLLEVLGVKVKTTKLNVAEKLRKISEAFLYLQQLAPELDFFHLNHFMHYGYVIDEGKKLIGELLNGSAVPLMKIYEIKRNAPERNYPKLLDKAEQSFYWNDAKFSKNQPGDLVYVVSRPNKEALFVSLESKGIPASYDESSKSSSFVHNGVTYRCDGQWDTFAHFRIHQVVEVPDDWNWTKSIGQSETYDLWKPKINNVPDRVQKIDDLLKLFTKDEAYDKLMEYREKLTDKQPDEIEIRGLLASDTADWPDGYITALKGHNHIIVWWDKTPSGGETVMAQLISRIKKHQFFDFYVSSNNQATYKLKVVDFSFEKDYQDKKWNLNEDVAEYKSNFKDYARTTKSGNLKTATIAFLVDEIEKLDQPIPVEQFVFFKNHKLPTQNNLQPFVDIQTAPPLPPKPSLHKTAHSQQEILTHIHNYAASRGFNYDIKDIANFYLSLKTKPFVILAGISGTGKTKLVELFAEAIGYGDHEHCVIIPVKPDWTDNSDLMGYTNLNKEFEKKKLTEVILNAHKNPDAPFFIILDEMNLARVEHYFSDFLSIIETRSLKDKKIHTKPLLYESEVGENTSGRDSLINIGIPENLYIVGTVNMDETTFPFSKKVLDRANSIEMNQVELDFIQQVELFEPLQGVYNDFLLSDKINSSHLKEKDRSLLADNGFIENLKSINEILAVADLQFAYRVRDEIAFYLINSHHINSIISWEEAMDYQVMQKILPRIQGSAISISYLLVNLINHFMGGTRKFDEKSHYADIQNDLQQHFYSNPKYQRTLKKLDFMLRRYSQDGFTSFWI